MVSVMVGVHPVTFSVSVPQRGICSQGGQPARLPPLKRRQPSPVPDSLSLPWSALYKFVTYACSTGPQSQNLKNGTADGRTYDHSAPPLASTSHCSRTFLLSLLYLMGTYCIHSLLIFCLVHFLLADAALTFHPRLRKQAKAHSYDGLRVTLFPASPYAPYHAVLSQCPKLRGNRPM
jgi:hypothetical protein